MWKDDPERQRGQSMVLITLLIVVMLVFAGLVMDGGYAYALRRETQNAADAGALAGAQELARRYNCDSPGSALDDVEIAKRINNYVERNGVPDSNGAPGDATNTNVRRRYVDKDGNEIDTAQDIGQVGYVPAAAVGVRVVPNLEVPTFLMGLVGISQITVAAEAEACMGTVKVVNGGMFPVLVHESVFEDVTYGDNITIWNDDETIAGDGGEPLPSGASRGWANFNYVYSTSGNHQIAGYDVSSADLKNWAQNGWNGTIQAGQKGAWGTGDYIHGQPGVIASVLHVITVGSEWVIPIYDAKFQNDLSDPPNNLPEPDPYRWQTGDATSMYHIIGFARVKITQVQTGGSHKYIKTKFLKFVGGGLGVDPNDPDDPQLCLPTIKSVGLTR